MPTTERPFTAWHFFFAQLLAQLADRQRLQVHAFERLAGLSPSELAELRNMLNR